MAVGGFVCEGGVEREGCNAREDGLRVVLGEGGDQL